MCAQRTSAQRAAVGSAVGGEGQTHGNKQFWSGWHSPTWRTRIGLQRRKSACDLFVALPASGLVAQSRAKSIWVMARAGMNPGSALSWLCCSEQVASPSWIWRARTIVSTLQDCMRKKRDHSRNTRGTQSPQSRGWVELNRC